MLIVIAELAMRQPKQIIFSFSHFVFYATSTTKVLATAPRVLTKIFLNSEGSPLGVSEFQKIFGRFIGVVACLCTFVAENGK